MPHFTYNGKDYETDPLGFLKNPFDWDENYAEGIAKEVCKTEKLTEKHWQIIYYLRNVFKEYNSCPSVFVTCNENNITLDDFRKLFPSGYQRGACRVAGYNYRLGYFNTWLEESQSVINLKIEDTVYQVDIQGFLQDWKKWTKEFAQFMAIKGSSHHTLTSKHWELIEYIRVKYQLSGEIPTIYQTCEENSIKLSELEELFPEGYHRGLIKLAGIKLY
jgi:tRNA 2-thiouridine synthesizing protein E